VPPKSWMKFSSASTAIKIIRDQTLHSLYEKLMRNAYQEARKPKQIYVFDNSHNKHGKKRFHIWICLILRQINFPWFGLDRPISNNMQRKRILNFENWIFFWDKYFKNCEFYWQIFWLRIYKHYCYLWLFMSFKCHINWELHDS